MKQCEGKIVLESLKPDNLKDRFKAECKLIKDAPMVCVSIILVTGLLTSAGFIWIGSKHTQVLYERIEALKEDVVRYQQKIGELPPPDNPYLRLSHEELKNEVLKLVSDLKRFANKLNSENYPMFFQMSSDLYSAKEKDEKIKVYYKYANLFNKMLLKDTGNYNSRFKIKAIIFRDEMISRLPKEVTEARDVYMEMI
jgi:hypothetical protein